MLNKAIARGFCIKKPFSAGKFFCVCVGGGFKVTSRNQMGKFVPNKKTDIFVLCVGVAVLEFPQDGNLSNFDIEKPFH
jgi:hypothetical protein